MVDLGFQPESLTLKPELSPLCQTDSCCGCGVNEGAWAALRIRVSREARPESRSGMLTGEKMNSPQNDISIVINLDDLRPVAHSEKSYKLCSSFSSFQNIRNVLKYGSVSSSDYLNCTTVRQTRFQASSHLTWINLHSNL